MKKKLQELEERAKLESAEDVDSKGKPSEFNSSGLSAHHSSVAASGPDVDARSIYVGNVRPFFHIFCR